MRSKYLFVDLDGTITQSRINNTFDFIWYFYRFNRYKTKMKIILKRMFDIVSLIFPFMEEKIRRFQILTLFRGLDVDHLKKFAEEYWIKEVYRNLNKGVLDLINYYRNKGYRLIMLTACTEIPARIIGKNLNFHDVISTTFIVRNNKIEGIKEDTFANLKVKILLSKYPVDVIRNSCYITDTPHTESNLLKVFKLIYIVKNGKVTKVMKNIFGGISNENHPFL